MQTTLLGLAIAIIIALVAALVGPSFIDWNQYKPQFEAEAARVVGAPVRVEGALDARLLPAPILRLHTVSVGAPNDATRMRADKLDVEFSLSSLMRGEWRATHLSLDGAAIELGLDQKGGVIAPSRGAFNFGALAIDKLDLTGRINVHDAASGADYAVNDIVFSGDVRALGSNMRGEGSFAAADLRQPFRLVMSQMQDNKGTRVRIDLDPVKDGAVSGGIDGALTFDQRAPRFDGAVTLVRQGDTPWRVSAKTKAAPAGASFEQADIVYGSEETGLKLTGSGDVSFGKSPLLRASLSAQQLDADRALSKGEAGSRAGIPAALRSLLAAMPALPLSSQIDFSADQITLGGKPVQGVTAKLRGAPDAWTIDKFDLTAPGSSRVTVSGTVKPLGADAVFTGPVSLQTDAAKTFADWLQGSSSNLYRNTTPLHLTAAATFGKDRAVLKAMKGDLNGSSLEGNVALSGSSFKLALTSPSLNLDDVQSLVDLSSLSLPSEAQISLDVAQAKIGGRDIRPLSADFAYKANGQPSLARASANLVVRHADLTPLLGVAQSVTDFTSKLAITDNKISFTKIDGKLGDARVRGNLIVTRGDETSVEGNIGVDSLDVGVLTGLALGASGHDASEPLAPGWFGWRGSLAAKAENVTLPGGTELKAVSGTLRGDGSSLVLDNIKATLGGGDVTASAQARRALSGTSVNADVKVANADASTLKYHSLVLPQGRASLQVTLASEGRSAIALTNALSGNGILTLKDIQLGGLDPAAFDAAIQAADDTQTKRDVKDVVTAALDQASLAIASVQVPVAIKDARLRIDPTTFESGNSRAIISGGYDLPADQVDIRTSLRSTTLGTPGPEIQVFMHGTPDALQRDVDVSLLSSWLSLRAIERETKRLDDLEKGSGSSPPPNAGEAAPTPAAAALPSSDMHLPGAGSRKHKPPRSPVVRAPAAPQPNVTASDQQLAPLPPPIDIRPAPGTARPRRPPALLLSPGATF